MDQPRAVYINWAAYDEVGDKVELTETLAMRQLDELLRLREWGVRLDAYVMDAFWYAPEGGYRTWRQPHWPTGPDRWLDRCLENRVQPGLWLSTNTLCGLKCHPAWQDSLSTTGGSFCFFHGNYLPHLLETMHLWFERGVQLFKFDFADLTAATPALERTLLPSEIIELNCATFRAALKSFRAHHPGVTFLAYNGFEEYPYHPPSGRTYVTQSGTFLPFRKTIDARWLEAFDSLYCGDPRLADIPCANFWRAKDIYSDHMVRVYLQNGIPLERIDNCGFMIGTTATCYYRRTAAWQGMLLLSLARGGWLNAYYGNLDLLDEPKARWFARAQALFFPLQATARFAPFGGVPGQAEPYGFSCATSTGTLYTVVNPSQSTTRLTLPGAVQPARVLFADAGFVPTVTGGAVELGAEQLALVGTGSFASPEFDLGIQADVRIPDTIERVDVTPQPDGDKALLMKVEAPRAGSLRVLFRQTEAWGGPLRSTGGGPPNWQTMDKLLQITAVQEGRSLPVTAAHDKIIWSGLSWAAGEFPVAATAPVTIRCVTAEPNSVKLSAEVFLVQYQIS